MSSPTRGGGFGRRAFLQRSAAWAGLGLVGPALAACGPLAQGPGKESGAPVTVPWSNLSGPLDLAFTEEFEQRFNGKYGPKITAVVEPMPVEGGWRGRFEKWTTMAVSGTMPPIIWLCCIYIRPFMLKGLVMEMDKFIKRDWKPADSDDFFKGPYDGMKVEGKQLGIPVYINTNIMFVNKNHLQQAGLTYPSENWTKQQFLDYVLKLRRSGRDRWGYDMPFTGLDRNITWIWNNGGEPHDPRDGPVVTRLTYDDPKTIEGLQFLHDLIWKHQVSPKNNDDRGGMSLADAFLNGRTAIRFGASGDAGGISTNAPNTGLDWDFLPLVKGPQGHGARISMDGYMVDKQAKHPEQTWVVLRELVGKDAQVMRAQLQRRQPPTKSGASAWEQAYAGKNARLGKIMAETARADPRAFWKDADHVGDRIVGPAVQATLLRNELPVAEAMRRAMEEVRGYYAANK